MTSRNCIKIMLDRNTSKQIISLLAQNRYICVISSKWNKKNALPSTSVNSGSHNYDTDSTAKINTAHKYISRVYAHLFSLTNKLGFISVDIWTLMVVGTDLYAGNLTLIQCHYKMLILMYGVLWALIQCFTPICNTHLTPCLEHFFDFEKIYGSNQVNAADLTVNKSMHCLQCFWGQNLTCQISTHTISTCEAYYRHSSW
jgi:hypothetical protein